MKSFTKSIVLSLIVIGSMSVVPTVLSAEEMPDRGPIPFEVFDANKDGSISEYEFKNTRADRIKQKKSQGMPMRNVANAPSFRLLDSNDDGKIDKLELLEGQNKQMQKNRGQRGQRNR